MKWIILNKMLNNFSNNLNNYKIQESIKNNKIADILKI